MLGDPIRFQGGDTNLYGYVVDDPVNRIDPSGLSGVVICVCQGTVCGCDRFCAGEVSFQVEYITPPAAPYSVRVLRCDDVPERPECPGVPPAPIVPQVPGA